MGNISPTLYTNGFFSSVLKSPIQMGSLSVNNSVTNISRLGTFNKEDLIKDSPTDRRTLIYIFEALKTVLFSVFAIMIFKMYCCLDVENILYNFFLFLAFYDTNCSFLSK